MKKGLLALFAAVALSGVTNSFAYAPIVSNLPDIIISEQEDNGTGTDNNFFVYTNAFKFDNFVNDDSTTESGLAWSFDEGDSPAGTSAAWFNVNGKAAVHVGTGVSQMGSDPLNGYAAHKAPANDVRLGNQYASFRDIVFTPGTGGLPGAKRGEPTEDHSAGKFVQFYVSDGTTVTASNLITVKSINNVQTQFDQLSGGSKFVPIRQDHYMDKFVQFNTLTTNGNFFGPNGNTSNWYASGDSMPGANQGLGPGLTYDYDSTYQALRVRVYSASSTVVGGATYALRTRQGGWYSNATSGSDIPYSQVGSSNVVRGKFWVFYQPISGNTIQNSIPGFALRVGSGFAMISNLEITGHSNDLSFFTSNNPDGTPYNESVRYNILNPASTPQTPSMYRVDYKPVQAAGVANEPITRSLLAAGLDFQDQGYMELAESILGVYPASLVDVTSTSPLHVYDITQTSKANGSVKLWNAQMILPSGVSQNRDGEPLDVSQVSNGSTADIGGTYTGTDVPTAVDTANGISFETSKCVTTKVGIVEDYFMVGNGALANSAAYIQTIPRVSANKQYVVRFRLNSTQQSSLQSNLWLYTRTNGFSYIQKTEFAGGQLGIPDDMTYLKNAYPGIGGLGNGTQQWYSVYVVTPLQPSIRPEYSNPQQALSVGMKSLYTDWGPGASTRGSRDMNIGLVCLDTLNLMFPQITGAGNWYANARLESTQISCDRAEVYEFPLVID